MSPSGGNGRRRSARLTLAAVGAALLLASGCFGWAQKGYDSGKTGYNPAENTLTAATVAGLQPVWDQPGPVLALVSSGNSVHAVRYGDLGGEATTYRADTGAQLWTKKLERYVTHPYVAVLGDTLAVTTGAQQEALGHNIPPPYLLSAAFDVATGETRAHPFYAYAYPTTGDPSGDAAYGTHVGLVPLGGTTKVMFDDARPDGQLGGNTPLLNEPAGTAYTQGIVDFNPVIQAWGLSCIGSGCQPRWSHAGSTDDAVLEGSSGSIYVAGDTQLEVLHEATGGVKWTAPVGSSIRPAVGRNTAYLVGGAQLTAVPACGSATCAPSWSAALPTDYPSRLRLAVAGDVAYVAATTVEDSVATTHVLAFDADGCGAAVCAPLTTVTAPGGVEDLLVAKGRVVVGTDAGVHAFGLPA